MIISPDKLIEIVKKGYGVELLPFLEYTKDGIDIEELKKNTKLLNIFHVCERKGLISDEKLTIEGEDLLKFFNDGTILKYEKKKKIDEISLFWSVFPSTDTFEYKGKKFIGSRALKTNKPECKLKLQSILNEGDYKIEDIIEAVKLDVFQKKEMSYKTGTNKLSFIQNSLTYLRQRSFEPYIELVKAGHKVKEENKSTEFYA